MTGFPFSVYKRKGRKFFYVQFKSPNGEYLPALSTGEANKPAAIETAFRWLREGRPLKDGGTSKILLTGLLKNLTSASEAEAVCLELKKRGFLKNYTLADKTNFVSLRDFLTDFWNYDSSPYIKEKLRKNHSIHKNYVFKQQRTVLKYWVPFFQNKNLQELLRKDIDAFADNLSLLELSPGRKNIILMAGTVPIKWAFTKGLIDKDIATKLILFSGKSEKRNILDPDTARTVFSVKWVDERARVANLLAAVTGLRSGEIQGLRIQDIGEDCLYIRHSWNIYDGLKPPKNNETRTVEVPFPTIINDIKTLALHNPHGTRPDNYIFWHGKDANAPIEGRVLITGLRDALRNAGMNADSCKKYVFHGWRHFFTSYMLGRIDDKLLQTQTGHKTRELLFHYAGHVLKNDREKIHKAQTDAFKKLVAPDS